MAVHITGLDPSITLAELLQSIAATAPVGMVLSARLLPAESTGAPRGQRRSDSNPSSPSSPSSLKADIVFGNDNAPYDLRRRARDGSFLVRGRAPFVAVNNQLVFNRPKADLGRSRVLRIRGPAGVEGFNEEAMRHVLTSDAAAMEAVGALGVDSEPVETRDGYEGEGEGEGEGERRGWEQEGGMRTMEWRFFDHVQARAFKRALRDHYGRRLKIESGPDPCWDYKEMTRYLSRSRAKNGRRASIRQQQQQLGWLAPVVDPSAPVYPAYFLEAAAETGKHT
ncbi:hypothetical protein VSDG_07134 [Cytospora chrysosperma]|uniref:Uncharacterized protein n=1 Tax=Cytospora chrysosperma TaxID=252740 RepID=A0A423VKE5_CYTCH|nr:hypothetical protein VSDG_07134 [Valsa sordida]